MYLLPSDQHPSLFPHIGHVYDQQHDENSQAFSRKGLQSQKFSSVFNKGEAGPTIQRANCIFIEPNFCETLNRWPGFRGVRSRPGIARSRSAGPRNSKSGDGLGESCLRQEKASVGILMTDSMLKAAVRCMEVGALVF